MIEINPEQHQLMESDIDQAIEFLNKEIPDWKSKINWDIFSFNSPRYCIAGQLKLDYLSNPGFNVSDKIIQTLDFSLPSTSLYNAYQYMGNLWKQKAKPV